MEVEGEVVTMTTGDLGTPGWQRHRIVLQAKAERRLELVRRRQRVEEVLRRKISELRELCLQEAELTGLLPKQYPLEVGEEPPTVSRRPWRGRQTLQPHQGQWQNMETYFHVRRTSEGIARGYMRQQKHRMEEAALQMSQNTDGRGDGQTIGCGNSWTLLPGELYQGRRTGTCLTSPIRLLQRSVSGASRSNGSLSPAVCRDRAGRFRYPILVPGRGQRADGCNPSLEPRGDVGAEPQPRTRRSSSSEVPGLGGGTPRSRAGRSAFRLAGSRCPEWQQQAAEGPQGPCAHRRPVPTALLDREIHRALALEGLRDWYVRSATSGPPRDPVAGGHHHRLYTESMLSTCTPRSGTRRDLETWRSRR
ncbi:uncharacterized protein [Narcine bancroftii]|uniref:uncharacterized protein n=1 Tax=Narcine bancroftii TaxID=1343680 RepID=UPI003832026F